jgi:hypothetical protein
MTDVKLTELLLAQLETEAPRARCALESVPDGFDDWQPYASSPTLGRLASLVAGLPFWLGAIVHRDSIDLDPLEEPRLAPPPATGRAERLRLFDDLLLQARAALEETTDEHLRRPWRLLERGRVVSVNPRHVVLRETFVQLVTYRGQLQSHLRLNEREPMVSGVRS